jgi:hypothetical protein
MKIKKKNSNKDFFLFDVVIKEKYLLLFILIVSITFTLSSHFKKSLKLQEINSKAFIEFPNSNDEFFYLTNTLASFAPNNLTSTDYIYIKNKFSYDLSSLDNLLDFLSLEKNLKYLENFNKNNLNVESYLKENFKLSKDTEFNRDFLIIISMKHPINFDGKLFLNDYIKYVTSKSKSEIITSKLKLSDNILDLLNKKNIIQKEWEKNSYLNYKELLDPDKDKIISLELHQIFRNYFMTENNNSTLFFSQTGSDFIVSQINLVKELTDKIKKISFEPKFEIQTDKTVYVQNYLIRNLVLNIIISFIIFFSIISFKQIFKKFLN